MSCLPKRYVCVDTESNTHYHRDKANTRTLTLRLGCAVLTDTTSGQQITHDPIFFTRSHEFMDWLDAIPQSSEPIYVFAHNMGFDSRMLEWFWWVGKGRYTIMPPPNAPNAKRYKQPLFVAECPPFLVRLWRPDGQQIMLLDTMNWFCKSLGELGTLIGVPKGDMPPEDAPDSDWFEYCYQDVYVLMCVVRRIFKYMSDLRITVLCPTTASQSMLLYKQRFEKKKIVRPEDESVLSLDRMGYFGGFVEAFFVGRWDSTTHLLDVSSLYPSVMRGNPYPAEIIATRLERSQDTPPRDFRPGEHTAEVYLESPDHAWPVRTMDGTLHVRGKVRTILCGPELERAWSLGLVRYLGRWVRYRLDDLFTPFITYMWTHRYQCKKHGDPLGDALSKAIMNSLHGKFGQKYGDWVHLGMEMSPDYYGSGKALGPQPGMERDFRVLAGDVFERSRDGEDPRGFVPIAAWTTSYGRIAMSEYRDVCGPGNVLYQATDSLIVTGDGLANLQLCNAIKEGKLGALRHQEINPWVDIRAINDVRTETTRRRAGIKKDAVQIAENVFSQDEWTSFSTGVFQGNTHSVFIKTTCVNTSKGYSRRYVCPSGWTEAWSVDNWETPPDEWRTLRLLP